jgi:hypothetical protein
MTLEGRRRRVALEAGDEAAIRWRLRPRARLLPVTAVRLTPVVLCVVVFLAAVGSTVDVLAFGIHDHLAGAEQERHDAKPARGTDGHGQHHCDLQVNPGEVAPRVELVRPMPASDVAAEPSLPVPASLPFLPFTPPRG